LTEADREIGMAAGRRVQAAAIPNPEVSFELDNALGSGDLRGLTSAETTLQLSQLIELGGKRDARIAAGTAELEAARWERAAVRLDAASKASAMLNPRTTPQDDMLPTSQGVEHRNT
jgi:cobalt-zinc-cadmium efflux system outer membrane protein